MAVTIRVKKQRHALRPGAKRMSKNRPGASAMASQNVDPHFDASTQDGDDREDQPT